MYMNNKHTAVIGVGILIVIFVGLAIWYMALHPAPVSQNQDGMPIAPVPQPQLAPAEHIRENAQYYEIDAAYPSDVPLRGAAGTDAVGLMRSFAEKEIARFKDNGNFANLTAQDIAMQYRDGRKEGLTIDYKVFQGAQTLSYVYTLFEDTLGAHPNTYYRTFTFDTVSGEALDLDSLFLPTANYLDRLSRESRAALPALISAKMQATADQDMILSGTQPEADTFQSFYIEGTNLVLVFPPYQVGPYVLGTVLLPIPLSSLSDILQPKYLP